MKKIMFNDRYGLTEAVLSGRKTMTRRIIKGDFEGIKAYHANGGWHFIADTKDGDSVEVKPAYEIGEKVAIAQKYWDLRNCDAFYKALEKADPSFPLECIDGEKGCYNKMFVKADWMPHHIRITNVGIEPLQEISGGDCLKEGVQEVRCPDGWKYIAGGEKIREVERNRIWSGELKIADKCAFENARKAFAALIDKISGKGTWESNPWVFVYSFESID